MVGANDVEVASLVVAPVLGIEDEVEAHQRPE